MNILYVATSTNAASLTAAEAAHRSVLIALGHTVTLRLHTNTVPASWPGIDLVMISISAQSNETVPKYNNVPVGVTTFDARKFPHSGVSTQNFAPTANTRTHYWFMSGNTVSDPLASGAETAVYPSTPADPYAYIEEGTQLPASAETWIRRDSATSNNVIGFGIEEGSTLADGSTLTGHRVSIVGISNPESVSDQAILDYINRALTWTANLGPPDTVEPSTPSGLNASVNGDDVTITWNASTDNVVVSGYQVYRDVSNNFTPSGSTQIGTTAITTYTDTNVPVGTYFYKIIAYDAASNESTASASIGATVSPPEIIIAKEWNNPTLTNLRLGGVWDGAAIIQVASVTLLGSSGGQDPEPDPTGDLPTASTTGIPAGATLTTVNLSTISGLSNQTFQNLNIVNDTAPGWDPKRALMEGNNNTFINCRCLDADFVITGSGNTIDHSEFGKLSLSGTNGFTGTNIKIVTTNGKDGLGISSDTGQAQNILLENIYISTTETVAIGGSGNHYDTLQVRGVQGFTLRNCVFDQGTVFSSFFNATIFLENANGGNDDVLLENVYSRAAGYFHLYLFATNLTVRNFEFARVPGAPQTKIYYGGTAGFIQEGNTWDDGEPVTIEPGI